jgi:hypothetical protein
MSLAITAAPFDTDNQNHNYSELNSDDTPVNRKRQPASSTHNKTQKRMSDMQFDPEKVNNVLQSIHNNGTDNELGDFNPKRNQGSATQSSVPINPLNTLNKLLAPPVSMREKEDRKEGFHNNNNEGNNNLIPAPLDNAEMDLQELQSAFLNDAQVRDYYKKLVPNYNHKQGEPTSSNKMQPSNLGSGSGSGTYGSNDVLLNKINYMINLLEDQQDERTNNVTEEVVLYSFLGIFIIFVVDSFARVGKYTR